MPYTIKHIKLFENSPFKKIIGNSINNDNAAIARVTDNIRLITLKKIFNDMCKKSLCGQINNSRDEYIKSKQHYNKILQAMRVYGSMLQIGKVDYLINTPMFKFYDDIDVQITSDAFVVILSCVFVKTNSHARIITMFDNSKESITPYDIHNGFYEYIFNDKNNGYIDVLKKYGVNLPVKVKFKIMNPDEVNMPEIIFYNYQDGSYINDFENGFINVFSNYSTSVTSNSNSTNVFFLNCFGNSTNLSEVNNFVDLCKNMSNEINVHMLYFDAANDMSACYEYLNRTLLLTNFSRNSLSSIFSTGSKLMIQDSLTPRPNFTSLNTTLLNAVNRLNLRIIVNNNIAYNYGIDIKFKRLFHEKLSEFGFTNKLIKSIDTDICVQNNLLTSVDLFLKEYTNVIKYVERNKRRNVNDHSYDDIDGDINNAVKQFGKTRINTNIDEISIYNSNQTCKVYYNIII